MWLIAHIRDWFRSHYSKADVLLERRQLSEQMLTEGRKGDASGLSWTEKLLLKISNRTGGMCAAIIMEVSNWAYSRIFNYIQAYSGTFKHIQAYWSTSRILTNIQTCSNNIYHEKGHTIKIEKVTSVRLTVHQNPKHCKK